MRSIKINGDALSLLHTPGPWKIIDAHLVQAATEKVIARITDHAKSNNSLKWVHDHFPSRVQGNNLLMVQAPEMLNLAIEAYQALPNAWENCREPLDKQIYDELGNIIINAISGDRYSVLLTPSFAFESPKSIGGAMIEHNQGPWSLWLNGYVVDLKENMVLANVEATEEDPHLPTSTSLSSTTFANQLLISAAPHLLSALVQLRALLPDSAFAKEYNVDAQLIHNMTNLLNCFECPSLHQSYSPMSEHNTSISNV